MYAGFGRDDDYAGFKCYDADEIDARHAGDDAGGLYLPVYLYDYDRACLYADVRLLFLCDADVYKRQEYDYAHRGLHSPEVPENSIPAFERAIRAGYAIELDVHRSKDGVLMVFHDDDLERMTGASGRIEDLTLAELACLRLAETKEGIPTFDQVLQIVDAVSYTHLGRGPNH